MSTFNFNIGNKSIPIIRVTANGLSFNQQCIFLLNNPEYVCIGLDKESKLLGIKAMPQIDKTVRCYPFVTDEKKKKHINITASQLRTEIFKLTDLKPCRDGIKYLAEYDDSTKMLIVDLKQTINF